MTINNLKTESKAVGTAKEASLSPGASLRTREFTQYGAYMEFKNGVPIAKYKQPPDGLITKQIAHSKFLQAMSEPFSGQVYDPCTKEYIDVELPQFIGKPMIEVMNYIVSCKAVLGDLNAYNVLMDRAYGKPAQETKNINIDATKTYEQFVESLLEEQEQQQYADVIDVTVNNEPNIDEILEDF
jgi:hypothetical protein